MGIKAIGKPTIQLFKDDKFVKETRGFNEFFLDLEILKSRDIKAVINNMGFIFTDMQEKTYDKNFPWVQGQTKGFCGNGLKSIDDTKYNGTLISDETSFVENLDKYSWVKSYEFLPSQIEGRITDIIGVSCTSGEQYASGNGTIFPSFSFDALGRYINKSYFNHLIIDGLNYRIETINENKYIVVRDTYNNLINQYPLSANYAVRLMYDPITDSFIVLYSGNTSSAEEHYYETYDFNFNNKVKTIITSQQSYDLYRDNNIYTSTYSSSYNQYMRTQPIIKNGEFFIIKDKKVFKYDFTTSEFIQHSIVLGSENWTDETKLVICPIAFKRGKSLCIGYSGNGAFGVNTSKQLNFPEGFNALNAPCTFDYSDFSFGGQYFTCLYHSITQRTISIQSNILYHGAIGGTVMNRYERFYYYYLLNLMHKKLDTPIEKTAELSMKFIYELDLIF